MQLNTHRAKHKCVYHTSGYNTNVYIHWCIHVCVCVCMYDDVLWSYKFTVDRFDLLVLGDL
jgi:hypothetical protein